jgi:hypothetical protein
MGACADNFPVAITTFLAVHSARIVTAATMMHVGMTMIVWAIE